VLALIVSFLIAAYFLVPATLFRLSARPILKKFQRTRLEEITFAGWVSLLPLGFAVLLVYPLSKLGVLTFTAWADYKEVLAASYSEEFFRNTQDCFWRSAQSVTVGQSTLLGFVWLFSALEGYVFLALVRNYGRWRDGFSVHNRVIERLVGWLLGSVSEWYLMLTTVNFPPKPARSVAADLLTAEDHLYQGIIGDYFLDPDGELSGILLTVPRRFDRTGYLAAKEKNPSTTASQFWKEIPGYNLYLPRDKILSLNLRYPLKEAEAAKTPASANAAAATLELAEAGLTLRIEPDENPTKES